MPFVSWKIFAPVGAGLCALALGLAAEAHGSMKPEHGGVVQMSGETSFELVNGGPGVALYVKDDEDDIASSAMTAKLTITTKAGKTSSVPLAAAGSNKFEAKGLKLAPGSKVGVMVVDKATQARSSTTFTIN
ncbi:hypothetical protein LJR225_004602 [Phenylobacterium sp. LjRoot225]|uniref:hypothetical protein n=1 Tax=Phenylobacterium sp. LjRoot225 TaxID=3342285 RepID=UPI003ECCF557